MLRSIGTYSVPGVNYLLEPWQSSAVIGLAATGLMLLLGLERNHSAIIGAAFGGATYYAATK